MAGVTQRYQEADFLNVGTSDAEEYAFMGTGFTKIDHNMAAKIATKKYVSYKSDVSDIVGYAWTAPFVYDVIEDEKAIEFMREIGQSEKTGAEAITDYLRVYLNKPVGSGGKVFFAKHRKVAIETSAFADNGGELQGSGNLHAKSDWVDGKFDMDTKTFTPEEV